MFRGDQSEVKDLRRGKSSARRRGKRDGPTRRRSSRLDESRALRHHRPDWVDAGSAADFGLAAQNGGKSFRGRGRSARDGSAAHNQPWRRLMPYHRSVRDLSRPAQERAAASALRILGNPYQVAAVMPRLCFALSLTVALSAVPVRAADLLQIYRDALANDSTYASARATRDAGLESLPQGLAQILPTVNATAFTQYNDVAIGFRGAAPEQYLNRQGNSNGYTVTLTQPLFNWQNIQVYKEAGFKAVQAEATFGQATQDLIVRAAQAYFDVLASQDSLAFIQGQKVAISEQLAQAKRNFEVGTATITDTHEAQARFDLATSQEIAAQSELEIKKRTLQQIVGNFQSGSSR